MGISRRTLLKGAAVAVAGGAAASYVALRNGGKVTQRAKRSGAGYMKQYRKTIVLGMDGLDPRIVQRLMSQGAAPNFGRLWQDGCGGPLGTATPSQSPVVWTTLATGTNPGKHGVFDFIHRDPKRPLPFLSVCQTGGGLRSKHVKPRQNRAFWDVLTERGVPVTVVRWPVTFPAEDISGRMFSGLGVPGIRGTLGHYTLYTNDRSTVPDVGAERLVEVELDGGATETLVRGPMVRGLTGASESTIPLHIDATHNAVTIQVAGKTLKVAAGQWSDWVRMKFSTGAFKSVTGIAKFHLAQTQPALKLYMTPLEADPLDPAYAIATPEGYAAELADSIGTYHTLGMPEDTKALNEGAISDEVFIEQCNEITEERFAMFRHEFNRFTDGVLAFVFDTSDRIQHMFWRDNEVDADLEVQKLTPSIREHYLAMDQFLGEVLGGVDDDTALLLVSDHGFTSFQTCFDLNAWLAEEGFMKLTANPADVDEDEAALWNLVDWPNTVAYGCGFSSLYFNMKGREGHGIVDPEEAPDLAAKIAERMGAYRDPRNGKNPVTQIVRREEAYSGAQVADAPDILIGTAPGYRMGWQTPIGGVAPSVLSPNERHWAGDHIMNPATVPGSVLSNVRLDLSGARARDIAPTVLSLMGLSAPEDCDGAALPAVEA